MRMREFCLTLMCLSPLTALTTPVDAAEAPTSEVRVAVVDGEGEPIPGTLVQSVGVSPVVTDEKGIALVEGLRAGRRVLFLAGPGFAPLELVVQVKPESRIEARAVLERVVFSLGEVSVSAGFSLDQAGAGGSGSSLDRETIDRLPAFGEDLYRAVSTLPGTSGGDLSSRFSVRGGLDTQVLVQLDGLELYEPFHLKDFQGVFSIVDPTLVGGVELITGGMPVEFGDRLSGALDMTSRTPTRKKTDLGVSFTNFWLRNEGTFAGGRGSWLVSARRGFLDFVLSLTGEGEDDSEGGEGDDGPPEPAYWDTFAKLEYSLSESSRWSFQLLGSDDTLDWKENEEDENSNYDTSYSSAYLWATHRWIPAEGLIARSVVHAGRLDRDRNVFSEEFNDRATVGDERKTTVHGAKQDWSYRVSDRRLLKAGWGARSYETDYDYFSDLELESRISDVRFSPPIGTFSFQDTLRGSSWYAYLADRQRFGRLTGELGLRYDRDLLGKGNLAPRLNLVYDAGDAGEWRAGAGRFYQSQRTNEIDVADGETRLFESERADGYYLGWSKALESGYRLRVEAYYRKTENPRPRFENLFEPWNSFPEAASDRVRIAPTSAESGGLELLVVSPRGRKWDWWASYTLAEVTERVDGRDQPRWIDQRHALTLNVNYRPNPRWNFNALWTWHSGWPTTPVSATTEIGPGGETLIVPVVGDFYSENLPSYHRLDLKVSRSVPLRRGTLTFYIDIQNAYNQENVRGYEYSDEAFRLQDDGSVSVIAEEETWVGWLPSFGIGWSF